MPEIDTTELGLLSYESSEIYQFENGLPAFEEYTSFIVVEPGWAAPLRALQSCQMPSLCFWTIPGELIHPTYQLESEKPDRLILLMLSWTKDAQPTVNVLAPLVLDVDKRRGRQYIQLDSGLSPCYPLVIELGQG